MNKLTIQDLWSLEQYDKIRANFRQEVLTHKRNRRIQIGELAAIYFEDQLTVKYQIQEMLRIEKIFDESGIQDELNAYNPLIPDGTNLKATFMLEIEDVIRRKQLLAKFIKIEEMIWMQVGGFEKVYAICNEDLPRSNDDKTASVHFLRFEFSKEMIAAFNADNVIAIGVAHQEYDYETYLVPDVIISLKKDFDH